MADDQVNVQVNADSSAFEASMRNMAAVAGDALKQLRLAVERTETAFAALGTKGDKNVQKVKKSTLELQKVFKPLTDSFESSITGMILGTTTWQKTVQRLAQIVLRQMVDMAVQSVLPWKAAETAKTEATAGGVAQRTAAEAGGQSTGLAQTIINTLKVIGTKAAETEASVYASVSAIPYVGWILAPAAAAAAFAAVLAFGSRIPSAAGGMWSVPADTIAMVHKQESIIPASVAQPMRDFFSGGASGGANYAITIQAIDTQAGAQFLMNNASLIAKSLAREMRNGNSALRGAV